VESTLRAFSLDSGHNGRRTSKALSRLHKRAGKIRDMDVLMDYASKLRHDDDEQACSVRLLEHLGAQRLKKARKFLAVAQRCATN
jgi:CHAD domain-containing protein